MFYTFWPKKRKIQSEVIFSIELSKIPLRSGIPKALLGISLLSLYLHLPLLSVTSIHSPFSSSSFFLFMELLRRQDQGFPERKGQKRKLEEEEFEDDSEISPPPPPTGDARDALLADVMAQVEILHSTFSSNEADRAAAKRATYALAELAKNGNIYYSLHFTF